MAQTSKVSGVATSVYTDDNSALCVRYHQTVVWQKTAEGSIILRTGGWRTATTKARMNQAFNQFGPACSVYQKKGAWFVRSRETGTDVPFDDDTLVLTRFGQAGI
jgi:hypothetical protein